MNVKSMARVKYSYNLDGINLTGVTTSNIVNTEIRKMGLVARKFSSSEFYKNGDRTDKINIRQMAMINFKNYGFLINPSGLGFYNQIGNLEIGNRMLPGKVIPKLKPIQCTIVFEDYVRYNAFSNNCA